MFVDTAQVLTDTGGGGFAREAALRRIEKYQADQVAHGSNSLHGVKSMPKALERYLRGLWELPDDGHGLTNILLGCDDHGR